MSSNKLKLIVPVVVVAVGVAAAILLATARKAPPRTERVPLGPLVEVLEVHSDSVPVVITGYGQVGAKLAVDLVPQVGGRVVRVDSALVAGGFFPAGRPLIEIEPRDYELAVERARAAVARAQVVLEQQRAEAEVAAQEWEALNPGSDPPSGLVVREPQVRQAEAELAAAEADLQVAQLNLERTRITVPFDGVVVNENVDVGQYVAPGQPVARVYGTKAVEVRVPLETRELVWFSVPRGPSGDGPTAEVLTTLGGRLESWTGRVVRMEAEVDPGSRMATIVVEVRDPYDRSGARPALLPGTFVDVRIAGRTVDDLIAVPRYAVHEGGRVWLVDEGTLRIRDVDIVRSDRDSAYVGSGLEDGDWIVVSALDAVTDGMAVRPAGPSVNGEVEKTKLSSIGDQNFKFQIPAQPTHPKLKIRRVSVGWVGENLQFAICNLQLAHHGRAA